jgi:hypothetical protein
MFTWVNLQSFLSIQDIEVEVTLLLTSCMQENVLNTPIIYENDETLF